MTWPPYSSDLNPIEMIWHKIKTYLYTHYPELRHMTAGDQKVLDAIVDAVIDENFLWSLVKSMPRRVQAVIKAHGGYTKY